MSKFWHGLIHVGVLALQVVNVALPYIAAPYNTEVAGALAAVQGVVALLNHKPVSSPTSPTPGQ